ncbi:transposase [Sulfurimonas sp.]
MQCFIEGKSALQAAKSFKISYVSAKNYYQKFRKICAMISEEHYSLIRQKSVEYEEYFYIEKSKKQKKAVIFDAHNFLTFDYDGYIYTLLMPSLHKYKRQLLADNVEDAYLEEFNKFKRISRIIKVSKHYNTIVKFWNYFEKNIVLYKGISNELFAYYLKEFEFKFNYSKQEGFNLLLKHYFKEEI